eukprot:366217-Chlamydomonas_euryale.AAC.11
MVTDPTELSPYRAFTLHPRPAAPTLQPRLQVEQIGPRVEPAATVTPRPRAGASSNVVLSAAGRHAPGGSVSVLGRAGRRHAGARAGRPAPPSASLPRQAGQRRASRLPREHRSRAAAACCACRGDGETSLTPLRSVQDAAGAAAGGLTLPSVSELSPAGSILVNTRL